MIMETAYMSVIPGREEEFIAALEDAKGVLARAEGWKVISVHRGVERPSTFLLVIGWDSLEAHTKGFRGGDLFPQWRAVIGHYFAEPPQVEHWELLD